MLLKKQEIKKTLQDSESYNYLGNIISLAKTK